MGPTIPSLPTIPTVPKLGSDSAAFSPSDITGLQGWYKEEGIVGATNITQWSDSSGNSKHLTLLGVGNPTRNDAFLNGFDTVHFITADGNTGTPLARGAAVTSGTAATVFLVVLKDGSFGESGVYLTRADVQNNHHPFSDNIIYDAGFSTIRKVCGTQILTISNNWRIITHRSQANDFRWQIDSTSQFTTGTSTFSNGIDFILGCGNYNGTNQAFAMLGDMAEVIVYDQFLSDGQVAQVISYLQDRFNL